jgi:hypothetical protein
MALNDHYGRIVGMICGDLLIDVITNTQDTQYNNIFYVLKVIRVMARLKRNIPYYTLVIYPPL